MSCSSAAPQDNAGSLPGHTCPTPYVLGRTTGPYRPRETSDEGVTA